MAKERECNQSHQAMPSVSFSIRKKFVDQVLRDVVQMDVCHLLLGRPWQYDKRTCHGGKRNTYSLTMGGELISLLPMRKKVISKVQKHEDSNSLFDIKSFVKDSRDNGCMYVKHMQQVH